MNEKNRESFIRWQEITRTQFSYTINLIIALSTASLGFCINLLYNDNFTLYCCCKKYFFIGCILLLLSVGLGIAVVISRLFDFRVTTQIAKDRGQTSVDEQREESKQYGILTWILFGSQVITFLTGISVISILLLRMNL